MFRKIIKFINEITTKKKFTHSMGDLRFTVAEPNDFFEQATIHGFDPFRMACIQSYTKLENGKWYKGLVMAFESEAKMLESGIEVLTPQAR